MAVAVELAGTGKIKQSDKTLLNNYVHLTFVPLPGVTWTCSYAICKCIKI